MDTVYIKIKAGAEAPYDEWMEREYGSWEDHNCPTENHVYPILEREQYKPTIRIKISEAEILLKSITYWANSNSGDNLEASDRAGWKGWKRRIEKAIRIN